MHPFAPGFLLSALVTEVHQAGACIVDESFSSVLSIPQHDYITSCFPILLWMETWGVLSLGL